MGEPAPRRVPGFVPDLFRSPVTGLTCVAAIVLSLVAWNAPDVGAFVVDSSAFRSQPWRLITASLVHLNALHLAFNLYWLWLFGKSLEAHFGRLALAGLLVLTAVVSGAGQYALDWAGVGLSGVVYGLFGFIWVLARRDPRWRVLVDARTTWSMVVWFFLCIVVTATQIMPIGNFAHLFGAIVGALTGCAVAARDRQRIRWTALTGVFSIALLLTATFARPFVNPTESVAYELVQLGWQATNRHEYGLAESYYRRAIGRVDRHWTWSYGLGAVCWHLDHLDDAAAAYRRAHELAPSEPHPRIELAKTLSALAYRAHTAGESDRALALYRESVDLDDAQAHVWLNLGLAYGARGDMPAARKAIEHASSLEPDNAGVRDALKWLDAQKR